MKNTKCSKRLFGSLLCSAFAVALSGCTTYVEDRHPRTVYVPPPVEQPPPPAAYVPPPAAASVVVTPLEAPIVEIRAEADFYEPLRPHGQWVVVESYGRCWRPVRVDAGWRPYCDGHWQRTDAGWYWASDEPWGWATYHYGRWNWSVELGWFWVPHTQWAPAWVSWRQGAGYVGWAPLPPSARFGARGIIEVHERAVAPHAFVFVSEQRLLDPVRPTTVIVNNTTIVNQTVNITKVQMVNQTVINEGPRPEIIERKSGRRVDTVPVRELRRKEETEVVARRQNIRSNAPEKAQAPVRTDSAPVRTVPVHGPGQAENPKEAANEPQPQTSRNETRKPTEQRPSSNSARPEFEKSARPEGRPEGIGQPAKPISAEPVPNTKQEDRPVTAVPPRETRRIGTPSQTARPSPGKNPVRGPGELKSTTQPVRIETTGQQGNERQRELERAKAKPEAEQPGPARTTTPAPTSKQLEKRKVPTREKPAAIERGTNSAKKKEERKKGEEQENQQPPVPPRSP